MSVEPMHCTDHQTRRGFGDDLGVFCRTSIGDLVKIHGILRKEGQRHILENNVVSLGLRQIGENSTTMT